MKKLLVALTLLSSSAFAAPMWDCTAFIKGKTLEMVNINILAVSSDRLMVTRTRDFDRQPQTTFLGVLVKKPVILAKGGFHKDEPIIVELELKKTGVVRGKKFFDGRYVEYDKRQNGKATLVAVNFECEYLP